MRTLHPTGNLRAQDGIQMIEPLSIIKKIVCAARVLHNMSSTDERKIPKIVLKINRNELSHSSNFTELEAQNETIYSTKAAELVKNFDFSGSIPFSSLVRRVNQNAYKSLENVLELYLLLCVVFIYFVCI